MHARGVASLIPTVVLCLPSLAGGCALALNLLAYRNLQQWGETSAALVALAVLVGGPLVTLSTIIGGLLAYSQRISGSVKLAHLVVVGLAAISTISVLARFSR